MTRHPSHIRVLARCPIKTMGSIAHPRAHLVLCCQAGLAVAALGAAPPDAAGQPPPHVLHHAPVWQGRKESMKEQAPTHRFVALSDWRVESFQHPQASTCCCSCYHNCCPTSVRFASSAWS